MMLYAALVAGCFNFLINVFFCLFFDFFYLCSCCCVYQLYCIVNWFVCLIFHFMFIFVPVSRRVFYIFVCFVLGLFNPSFVPICRRILFFLVLLYFWFV
jgi:hypothetical protein